MPSSMKRFEVLFLSALLIGFVNAAVMFGDLSATAGAGFTLLVQGVVFFLSLALVLLVSRKRSRVAKWILVLLFVAGLIPSIPSLSAMLSSGVSGFLAVITLALQAVAIYFLFEKSSTDYLGAT